MIPLKLKISGLYSYIKPQEIDFCKLSQDNLFGIFGSVGSGKSTILEAISLSLFEITERLSKNERNQGIMNLRSNSLMIDFNFIAGRNLNDEFLINLSAKRDKKNQDKIKDFKRSIYKKNNEKWLPIESETLSQAIGLSYDNFKRTIIIPQGRFQEFLQLKDKDRTAMLNEIFNLDKFNLFYKASHLEKINNEKIQNITGQLNQIGAVNEDAIKIKEKDFSEIEEKTKELNKSYSHMVLQEKKYSEVKELFLEIQSTNMNLLELEKEEPFYKELEKKINEYEKCSNKFREKITLIGKMHDRINNTEKSLSKKTISCNDLKKSMENLENEFILTKEKYENRSEITKRISDLQNIIKIKHFEMELQKLKTAVKKDEEAVENVSHKIESLTNNKKSSEEKIELLNNKMHDITELNEIKNWFAEKKIHIEKLDNETKRKAKLLSENKEIKSSLEKEIEILTKNGIDIDKSKCSYDKINELIDYITVKKSCIEKENDGIELLLDELRVKSRLHEYVENLIPGKPCPLCGATEHPDIADSEQVTDSLLANESIRNHNKKLCKSIDKSVMNLRNISTNMDHINKLIKESDENIINILSDIETHNKTFKWKNYSPDNEKEVVSTLDNSIKNQNEKKSHEEIIKKVNKEIESLTLKRENLQKLAFDKKISLEAVQQKIINLNENIVNINPDDYLIKKTDIIENEINSLGKEYTKIEKKYKDDEKTISSQKDIISHLSGEISSLKSNQEENHKELDSETKNLNLALAESGYENLDHVKSILNLNFDIKKERKKINDFRQKLFNLQNQIKELEIKAQDKEYDEIKHNDLKNQIEYTKKLITNNDQAIGSLKNEIKQMKNSLEKKTVLEKEISVLNDKDRNIKTLKKLFTGQGFVKYVSTVYLKNLCMAANNRFYKLTNQQMSLEISDNAIMVRDFLNDGKLRLAKTLSGGQTFQASLCLALALADSIQNMAGQDQYFFFLDEGFGSLDKEALQSVFQTLKSLRKENRIVGLISHLDELKQEVDTYINVTLDKEDGSKINCSY